MRNRVMIIITATLLIIGVACKAKLVSNKSMAPQKPSGAWQLVEINARNITNDTLKFSAPFIQISDTTTHFGGKDGCNSFGGEAKFKGDSAKIKIKFSTKMYCMESIDQEFNATIQKVNLWKIEGSTLILNRDKEVIMRFVKK